MSRKKAKPATAESAAVTTLAPASDDPRLTAFRRLLILGIFCHAYMWLAIQMTEVGGLARYPELWAWTPGLFFPAPIHFAINWFGFLAAALYCGLGRRRRLGALVFLGFAALHFLGLPERVPNHYLLIVVAAMVLASCPRGEGSRRELPLALLRWLCVLTYSFAFLHKLNLDYFDIERSPIWVVDTVLASLHLHDLLFHETTFFWLGLVVSLLAELSLPWLLLWRRTRIFAILGGLAFHGIIAAADAPDYTGVILAFYVLFLESDEYAAIAARMFSRPALAAVVGVVLASLGVAISYVASSELLAMEANLASRHIQMSGLWLLLFAIGYATTKLVPFLRRKGPAIAAAAMPRWSVPQGVGFATLAILYALNCLGPYLGLKFYFSQAMFSALALDGSNHYLIGPRSLRDNRGHYVELELIAFSGDKAKALLPRSAPLLELTGLQGGWVEKNYLFSVLRHACQEGMAPIRLGYVEAGTEVLRADACTARLSSYPFNLYPYAPGSPPPTFLASGDHHHHGS